jgi:hypothetical protein
MEAITLRARANSRIRPKTEAEHLIDYCSRPICRKEFQQIIGPGRRQEFCSDICRRAAEKEFRQLKSRLAHYEDVVHKLRIDVAAFRRSDTAGDGDEELPLPLDARQKAEAAILRADGVLKFVNPDEPVVQELRMFYEAVAPVIRSDT